VSNILA